MSALTDLFTALATKIRSKTGGSDTYTPPQMVNAIDDVYDAGVAAGTTPTQTKTVTAGTSATTVTPDAGYALSSVTVNPTPSQSKSATPTTSAQTISPDSGKLLSSVSVGAIQTQTKSATPSTSAQTVTPDSGKYLSQVSVGAIPSDYVIPTSITPSNTSPASMASGSAYKPTSSGYAISSYDSVSPSSSGTYFSSGMKKMTSSGYAYSSQQPKTATGTATLSTTATTSINLGFKPKYLAIIIYNTSSKIVSGVYNSDISTSNYVNGAINGSTTSASYRSLPSTTTNGIASIDATGFTMTKTTSTWGTNCYYFAIG